MDNSPIYIKMCDQFGKIEDSEWADGDHIYCPDLNKTIIYNFVHTNVAEMGNFVVKLFRQDQLQGMVIKLKTDGYDFWDLLSDFYHFSEGRNMESSMEQLWLAFVMKVKFDKTWNGEKWE